MKPSEPRSGNIDNAAALAAIGTYVAPSVDYSTDPHRMPVAKYLGLPLSALLALFAIIILGLGVGLNAVASYQAAHLPKTPQSANQALDPATANQLISHASAATLAQDYTVGGNLTVTGTAITGTTDVKGDLTVSGNSVFTGTITAANFSGNLITSGGGSFNGNVTAPAFAGSGSQLTNINATNITSGTLADRRLSSNVPLLNAINAFTTANSFAAQTNFNANLVLSTGSAIIANTITPSGAAVIGAAGQSLTIQGSTVNITATANGITNNLTFATPTGSNKTITLPNATGTVAVSATSPLQVDSSGNITCSTCLTGSGVGASVSSLNTLTGALTLTAPDPSIISASGSTITIGSATTTLRGLASFNSTNFSVTSGAVNTIQNINTTAVPTFGGLNLLGQTTSNVILTVKGAASQTADLLQAESSTGAVLAKIDNGGNITAGAATVGGNLTVGDISTNNYSTFLNRTVAGTFLTLTTDSSSIYTIATGTRTATGDLLKFGAGSSANNLVLDDTTNRVGIGTVTPNDKLEVYGIARIDTLGGGGTTALCQNGSSQIASCSAGGGGTNFIVNGAGLQANANFNIQSAAAANAAGIIRGAVSQTADLLQLQNSAGTLVSRITATGQFESQAGSYSTPANGRLAIGVDISNNGIIEVGGPNPLHLQANQIYIGTGNIYFPGISPVFNASNAGPTSITLTNSGAGQFTSIIKASSAQGTTDLLQIQNSSGAVLDRFTAAGNLGIGVDPTTYQSIITSQTITGNTDAYGVDSTPLGASDVTNSLQGGYFQARTSAAAYTLTGAYALHAVFPSLGAGSAVTNAYGLFIDGQKQTGVTNGYGIYQSGSSDINYFAGNVGIGTATPGTLLQVQGNSGSTTQAVFVNNNYVLGTTGSQLSLGNGAATGNSYSFMNALVSGGSAVGNLALQTSGGNVGIGTSSPGKTLQVAGPNTDAALVVTTPSGGSIEGTDYTAIDFAYAGAATDKIARITAQIVNGGGGNLYLQTPTGGLANPYSTKLAVLRDGNVCVGVTSCTNKLGVSGNIGASGTITASTTPDLSETIAAAPDVTAADVVMADPNNVERVVKTNAAYSGAAVGVISDGTSSFMINAHANKEGAPLTGQPLVLAGRVPVKITNEGGSIMPGDYLTTSSTPGYAMKATHAGPTIGKALGFFNGTTGTVLTLVNLSYYDPTSGNIIQGQSASFGDLNVSGKTTLATLVVTGSVTIAKDLTVQGTTTVADIVVNGHIITSGHTPTIVAGTGAGKTATASISGNDISGTVTITTGTLPAAGTLATVTFGTAYGAAPRVTLTPSNGSGSTLQYYRGSSTGAFTINSNNTPAAATTYTYDYHVEQ